MSIVSLMIIGLIFIFWLGLQIQPASFAAFTSPSATPQTIPLPQGLPTPVERFYRQMYGETIPVITSTVITGRATMRPVGPIALPARFRFTHQTGYNYRHYIEATLFGLPIMQVNECYLDGHSLMKLPWATDQGEKLDQAANLGLWAEAIWMPSIFLTDPRMRWEPVDDYTAILVVPFNNTQERFVIRFNPQTGLIDWFESMRYQNSTSTDKQLWLNHSIQWGSLNGIPTLISGGAIWMNDGKPWAIFNVEEIIYNADVKDYVRAEGL